MPIPPAPLRRGDRGPLVAALHRTLESLNRKIDQTERDRRIFGMATEEVIRAFQGQAALPVTGVFDDATRASIEAMLRDIGPFSVYGRITDANDDPVVGATVFAVDVDLRRHQVVGQGTADSDGEYEIRYAPSKFTRAEKDSADLVVRALLGDRRVGESDVLFNAAVEQRIDLASRDRHGPSEYERLAAEVGPLLDGAPASELVDTDVKFLSGETRRDPIVWRAFVRAQQLASETKIAPEAFHGWLRDGLPRQWDELRAIAIRVLRKSLVEAVAKNIIPAWSAEEIEKILAQVPNQAHGDARDLLGTAIPDLASRLAGSVDDLDAVDDDLLARLVVTQTLEQREADRLGLAISLHRLAGAAPAVVAALLDTEFPSLRGKPQRARDLAAIDPADWARALENTGAPLPPDTTRAAQGRSVAIEVATAYPEDSFRRQVARTAAPRTETVNAILARNPDVSFVDLDYLPDSIGLGRVDFGDLKVTERAQVVAELKAHQRVHAVTGNAIPAQELLQAGLTSASAIAVGSPAELVEATGLTIEEASAYHTNAVQIANTAALSWFGIYEVARDLRTTPVRVLPSHEQFFRPLEGYAGLVNDSPWCECEHCQSVLSPAAYFVDLMSFVEQHIVKGSFAGRETHPLHLEKRRPDLWDLELTCANTTNEVPTLDIVNEILERFLREAVPFADTAAIYKQLATQGASLQQPFTLPLERLAILLEHFGLTRGDVTKAMRASPAVHARARLGLSQKGYELVTTAVADAATLLGLFRLTSTATLPDTVLAPAEMAGLRRVLGLPHDTVEAILRSEFVNVDSSTTAKIAIELGKRDPNDVQNNTELVSNLTLRRLDRIHRFTRLSRVLPWTVAELDHVLARLAAPNAVAAISADTTATRGTLERIVELLDLNATWSLALDELLALTDVFPMQGLRDSSLFARLFDQPAFVTRDGSWNGALASRFTHPSWTGRVVAGQPPAPAGQSVPPDNALTRLLAGLQLTDGDFVELVAGLRAHTVIDRIDATQAAAESIALSRASIGVLYRHARLRRLLGCTVAELFQLVGRARTPSGFVETLADVRAVAELAEWRSTSGFTFEQLAYLLDPTRIGTLDPIAIATALVSSVRTEQSLELADTLFAQLGLTEAESRQLVAANLSKVAGDGLPFARTTGAYRVRPVGLGGLVIPASLAGKVTAGAIAALLAERSPLHLAELALGIALGRSREEVAVLRGIADPLDAAATLAIASAIHGAADRTRLDLFVARVCRFHALFASPVFDLAGLTFVATSPSVVFAGATSPLATSPAIDLAVVRAVVAYAALTSATDTGFTTASGPADVLAIRAVVVDVAGASNAYLARALRTDEARIAALRPHVSLPLDRFEALAVLTRCLALADQLGASGETLRRMVDESTPSATYDGLARAAEDVYGAFRSKYPDAATFAAKLAPFEDRIRTRKRDGLVDALMTRWPTPFSEPERLYEYFLVDVLVQGCARTSRIVAATTSLQLYVHRVLMNLERSLDWNPVDPNNPGVRARFSDPVKRREWQWRRYYRVWEANRRVFLYPENYLEPELRDDKTPLFEELEDSLLMQELDKASVHAAYSRYLTGFDELARLKIAGAYYDTDSRTLHLFGVTQDDAPVYYYRQVDESASPDEQPLAPRFSAWQKLALQIPVRAVSPILFEGRLYVFWVETTTRPVNAFHAGTSDFNGYRHTTRVKFSMLRPDGAWSSPQVARFSEDGGTGDSRIVEDPRDLAKLQALEAARAAKNDQLGGREAAVTTANGAVNQAGQDATQATIGRVNAQIAFQRPPTPEEIAACAAALIFLGIPPEITFAAIRAGLLIAWRIAADNEARKHETLRLALDDRRAAEERLRVLREEIASDDAAILAQVTMVRWDDSDRNHRDALDNYKPEGWQWERVYPEIYKPAGGEARLRITLVPKGDRLPVPAAMPTPDDFDPSAGVLHDLSPPEAVVQGSTTPLNWASGNLQRIQQTLVTYPGQQFFAAALSLEEDARSGDNRANGPVTADVQVVNGRSSTVIMEAQGDAVWMRPFGATHAGIRLGTSLPRTLAREFWHDGPDSLLDATFQQGLAESRSKFSPIAGQMEPARANPFHPDNACLTYFRETFFHIPFAIANHLNSQSKFADTQRWYHYIFDPTASQGSAWRYREFREPSQITMSLRDLLTDPASLAAYREKPFSPHAIARTRMTAYQKSIVMKYVDNLLDWGDSLFQQFTTESINEATMLYVMAQDILGPRPSMLGSCGEGKAARTYRSVRSGLRDVSDFLVELEAPPAVRAIPGNGDPVKVVIPKQQKQNHKQKQRATAPAPHNFLMVAAMPAAASSVPYEPTPEIGTRAPGTPLAIRTHKATGTYWTSTTGLGGIGVAEHQTLIPFGELVGTHGIEELEVKYGLQDLEPATHLRDEPLPTLEYDPVDLVPPKRPVFCIPPNRDLLAYWSRVEDRLFNIRNCRDITGRRRQVELFAPELDPRLLVRMTAAGLSIDDVLAATSGNLPPYRFGYLIEKAKQHAGTVQSLGAQLLSAFEKGDAEELSHLRAVHEQNLLTMRTRSNQLEIRAAEDAIESLRRQQAAVEYRRQHFTGLREVGQIAGERKQQQLQGEASNFRTAAGIAQVVASILTIIPDMGAPTAMKFGGSQLGAAGRAVAEGLNAVAAANEMAAARAGVEASNRRRDQEWQHQVETARLELAQIEKNIVAAEIKRDIAVQALAIHDQSVAQTEEMFAFFREKFSSADRYRLLSKELRRLHRLAFNSALTLARMAEQAYRAERPADDAVLSNDYWDAGNAGLLAGERLLSNLQQLERQFIERNYRELEVQHSFSLAQFAPDDLGLLRVAGECEIEIPEWFYDLTYPGQYRRRLKAVRVTIPCVTGPHANIGATLRLVESKIRLAAPVGQDPLIVPTPVPLRHTTSIATSKAQNDGGVFDFNFRDERYMPFEGAGAISKWVLSLPTTLRVFDYHTISDVILHLDYTAEYDEGLKQRWDGTSRQLLALLATASATAPLLVRTFDLRAEFPDAFHRLVSSAPGTQVGFELTARHFPGYLAAPGRTLETTSASLEILTPLRALPATRLAIGRKAATPPPQPFKQVTAPAAPTTPGPICRFELGDVLETQLVQGGVPKALLGAYVMMLETAVDRREVHDIVLRIGYRLVSPP